MPTLKITTGTPNAHYPDGFPRIECRGDRYSSKLSVWSVPTEWGASSDANYRVSSPDAARYMEEIFGEFFTPEAIAWVRGQVAEGRLIAYVESGPGMHSGKTRIIATEWERTGGFTAGCEIGTVQHSTYAAAQASGRLFL